MPKVVAIQNSPYYVKHDVTFNLGWLPSDAFNKGYGYGVSYTYYFKNYLAWEIINFKKVSNSETSLKKEFEKLNIDIKNQGFDGVLDYIDLYATTNLIYTPFYTKTLAFNKTVMHGNTSFLFGVGSAVFKETGSRLLVSAGIILRFFSSPTSSWKIDLRNHVYFEDKLGAVYALDVGVGYSIELGDPPKEN